MSKKEDKTFDVTIMGKVFLSDTEGMLDLNKIHNELVLKPSKRPNEFYRYKTGKYFLENGNSRLKEINHLGAGSSKFYVADEHATIAYAMWVDLNFYLEVVDSFVSLRQGKIAEALESAKGTMSEESGDKMMQIVWENLNGMKVVNQRTALQLAGIDKPIVFMRELRKREKSYSRVISEDKIIRQTYAPSKWTDRFTQKGFQWLLDNSSKINNWVLEVQEANRDLNKI
ncbi:anti-repressor Ant [Vibrio phage K460]